MLPSRREWMAGACSLAAVSRGADPPRKPRKDCFFGLHFDLHPQEKDTALGRDLTEDMVDRLLARVGPDFVQYDCKGHAGYLGFASKTGNSAPGIVRDSLAIWRKVTARHGTSLFVHFSGVWDSLAVAQHPEWARVRPDGAKEANQTSTFGPYVDELMIPELDEAATKFDLDGAWVDGECWATNPDYSAAAQQAFTARTGIAALPKSGKDAGWLEFLEINREQFRKYVRHYIDALHAKHPRFQIASNWLYSTYVPERPELPVDYLSGDYLGANSISAARLEARYLSANGKPWDLMAWGFHNPPAGGFIYKPAVQLQQEASVVLAQGGGFQIYFVPTRAGHIDDRHINVASRVGRFCRDRQALSHKSEPVPQVGLLFSGRTLYRTSGKLFGGWGARSNPALGMLEALLAAHYSVDVIPDWKLAAVAGAYPLVVVPDWLDIGEEAAREVRRYVSEGGSALICGAANTALFAAELQVKLAGHPAEQPAWLPGGEVFGNVQGPWQDVVAPADRVIESRFSESDSDSVSRPAAVVAELGKGRLAAICGPAGEVYAKTNAPAVRDVIARVARRLFKPMVEVSGPPALEIALRRKDGRLLVHCSNASGMAHAENRAVIDYVPAAGPVEFTLRMPSRPAKVTWEPGGFVLPVEWSPGTLRTRVERVDIHGILAIE